MATPGTYNFNCQRGNSLALTFRMKDAAGAIFDLTGSTLVFRAVAPYVAIRKETPTALLMPAPATGEVTLALTPSETRQFPVGAKTDYEIERRIGSEQITLLRGKITGIGGINDD